MQAQNESVKIKKMKDPYENDVCKIVPGLISLTIEEKGDDNGAVIPFKVQNYEDLAMRLRHALVSGNSIKMEFVFAEESRRNPGKIKKIKSRI